MLEVGMARISRAPAWTISDIWRPVPRSWLGKILTAISPVAAFLHEFLEIQGPVVVRALLRLIMPEFDIPLGRGGSRPGHGQSENNRPQQ